MLRLVQTWIIESSSRDALTEIAFAAEQARTAFGTESANIIAHHFALRLVIFRRAFGDFECVGRRVEDGGVSATGRFLTIAAVTIKVTIGSAVTS